MTETGGFAVWGWRHWPLELSVDFTGSAAIVHELAVRGLVVLLCGESGGLS